jgi:D-serine deaminase-like pyridoxal phosphate-dependent protein
MIQTRIEDVPTPALVVDLDILERNIETMASRARDSGVALRPHAKTHKVCEVGRLQLRAGAVGLTLAKTAEAEVFVDAGFEDVFLAYPIVGEEKAKRLLALSDRARIAVGVDSLEGARSLDRVFRGAGRRLNVLLEIDCGLARTGVLPSEAPGIAAGIAELPGLRLCGVFTHAGQAYLAENAEAAAAVGRDEGESAVRVAQELSRAGHSMEGVSIGSTPTAKAGMLVQGVTECRPGTYVYNDASQVSIGSCTLEDCALHVVATIVSVPARDRAVLDAGSKTLSSDPLWPRPGGHGFLAGRTSRIARLNEEHGVIAVAPGESFRVGERVSILPNHACIVSNLHNRIYAARRGRIEAIWSVAARGKVE